jgi:formylglycine-generating enzyme required for sulfatase activity
VIAFLQIFWKRKRHWKRKRRDGVARAAPMLRVPAGFARMPDGRRRWVWGFSLDVRPVSNADWLAYAQATGAACPPWMFRPGWDLPEQAVVGITQREAEAYARWLGKSLPSERQWQRAAGAASYPWGEQAPDGGRAVFGRLPHRHRDARPEAGERALGAGPYGHHDLGGNTWERLRGSVARGGFWGSPDPRAALRLVIGPEERSGGVGLRCAR